MNESEPSDEVPRKRHSVKTHRSMMPGEKCSGYLFTGYMADVIEEA